MDNDLLNAFAAVGGFSGIAALTAVLLSFFSKRAETRKIGADTEKTKADTMGLVVDGAGDLVDHYRRLVGEMTEKLGEMRRVQEQHTDQLTKLNRRVSRFEERVVYLTGGIQQLVHQIFTLGGTPIWTPTPWTPDSEDGDPGRETPTPPGS